MLKHKLVRRVYTIFLCIWLKKMHDSCLCYSMLYISFVLHCCVKQRTFRFEKVVSQQWKFYIMKKAITLYLHRFANLLNNKQ